MLDLKAAAVCLMTCGGALLVLTTFVRWSGRLWRMLALAGIVSAGVVAAWPVLGSDRGSEAAVAESAATARRTAGLGLLLAATALLILLETPPRDTSRTEGVACGNLMMMAAATLYVAVGNGWPVLWMGLELSSFSVASLAGIPAQGRWAADDSRGWWVAGLAAALFAMALATDPEAVRPRGAGEAGEALAAREATAKRTAVSAAFLVSSLGLRLAAAPFHLAGWAAHRGLTMPRQLAISVLGRAPPAIVAARLVAFGPAASPPAAIVTGVVASSALAVGSLLLTSPGDFRRWFAGTVQIQNGTFLAAIATAAWITATTASRPASEAALALITAAPWALFIADSLALLAWQAAASSLVAHRRPCEHVEELQGLGAYRPGAATLLTAGASLLAAFLPTPGFWARWQTVVCLWSARRETSYEGIAEAHPAFVALAALLMIGWLLQIAASVRVLERLWMRGPLVRLDVRTRSVGFVASLLLTGGLLAVGMFPSAVFQRLADPAAMPAAVPKKPKSVPGSGRPRVSERPNRAGSFRSLSESDGPKEEFALSHGSWGPALAGFSPSRPQDAS